MTEGPAHPDRGPALAVSGVSKAFTGTRALQEVSLAVAPGSVHALVGGNGSGKSTLIKILAGVVTADPGGEIGVGERRVAAEKVTPALARGLGLRFVHQHTSTFADMTVAENLAIGSGFETWRGGGIRWRRQKRAAAAVLRRFHIEAKPDTPLSRLDPATQAMVAIARSLQDGDVEEGSLLILDEPTATLAGSESKLVLDTLRRYAADGHTIVIVSHRLKEILQVADEATVLRDGRVIETVARAKMSEERLVEALVGRPAQEVARGFDAGSEAGGEPLLEIAGLRGEELKGVDLSVHRGEIVGVAGLQGSGRSELLEILFGARRARGGSVSLEGDALAPHSPGEARAAGVAFIPPDRARQALFKDMSVVENLTIAHLGDYWQQARLRGGREKRDAVAARERYGIRANLLSAPISTLSGGNQQKVILARWLECEPKLILLEEPTQGIDVGVRADIYRLLRAESLERGAVLVASSDLEELCLVCDRVLVIYDGEVRATLSREELNPELLEQLLLR